jgi:hypothetical protein
MTSGESLVVRTLKRLCCVCALLWAGLASTDSRGQVIISQIYGGGGNTTGGGGLYNADFIELYNTSAGAVNLSTWSVHYQAATGTTWTKQNLTGTIPANGYYLIRTNSTGANFGLLDLGTVAGFADQVSTFQNLDPVAGKVALLNSTGTLSGGGCPPTASLGTIQDYVGYGTTTNCSEPTGTPSLFANNAPAPDNRNAVFRRLCGTGDGDNNGTDFFVGVPSPRNTSVAASNNITGWAGGSPAIVRAGDAVLLVVVPRNCAGGKVTGATVNVNLSAIGGSNPQAFLDNGTGGDEVSGDGIYSFLFTVPGGTTTGTKAMPVSMSSGGNSGGCLLPVAISPNSGPTNDNCRSAQAIAPSGTPGTPNSYTAAGVSVAGNLTGAMGEYNASMTNVLSSGGFVSMHGGAMRRGLWYSCIGAGTTMTAELCASAPAFDSVIQVMCGSCDGLSVVAAGNDECGSAQARATWCSTAGQTYYVWVASVTTGATLDALSLKITDNNTVCAGQKPCTVCTPACVGGSTVEGETAPGYATNDGCDASTVNPSGAQSFNSVTVNGTPLNICGTLRALGASAGTAGTVDSDWYRFQAGVSDTFQATCIGQLPITIQIRQLSGTGTCTTNSLVAGSSVDRCATASLSTGLTAGNWYAFKVTPNLPGTVGVATGNNSGFMIGATSNAYSATLQLGSAPPNDVCGNSVASFTIPGAGGSASGSSSNATNDAGLPGSACPAGSKDVWHYFTPNASGNWLVSTCGSSYDTIVNVYSGACGALTQVGCNDDTTQCSGGNSEVRVVLTSGTLYRIRVASKSGTTGSYSVSVFPSPANDDCGSAQSINSICGTTTLGWGATVQMDVVAATTNGSASCVSSSRDVWYTFTPGVGGEWAIETCDTGTGVDTVLSMFDGCGGSELDCNDDAIIACTSSIVHSRLTPTLTPSTTYWIRVAMKGTVSTGGAITLTLIPPSPAANDVCQDPPDPSFTIPGGGGTVSSNLLTASSEGNAASSCQDGEGQKDLYYYFTPSSSCPWSFSTCGCPNIDTTISIHTVCPLAANNNQLEANCADQSCGAGDLSLLSGVGLVEGTAYVVRVSLLGSSSTPGPFTLTVTSGIPTNNACSAPTALVIGAAPVFSDTSCATHDGTASCDPGGASSRDLWYTVTLVSALAPTERLNIDTCGSSIDTTLAVFSGACGSLVPVDCNNDCPGSPCSGTSSCVSLTGLSAGTYRIRVSDKGLGGGGTFSIRAAVATTNDSCANALALTCGSITSGSTTGATAESPSPPTCNGPTGAGAQDSTYTSGVWYKVTLPGTPGVDDKTITADTLLTAYDSRIWIFSGGCAVLNCITMNDDIEGLFAQSKAAWRAVAGTEYLILVGAGSAGGAFSLRLACDSTPTNDRCVSPTVISGSSGSLPFSTVGATGDNNSSSSAMPTCNGAYSLFDVWYRITACGTGNLTLTTCGAYDTNISVHTACPTSTVSNQLTPTASSCNNEGGPGCSPGSSVTVAVTQGTQYLIRIAGTNGATAGGTGTLTWSLPESTPPTINNCPANITGVSNDPGLCTAVVSWTPPSASDGCQLASFVPDHNPGEAFPVGTTLVTYTATDASNNTAFCSFNVGVVDAENPTLTNCPGDIGPVATDVGQSYATVSWTPPTPHDNCPGVQLSSTHNPGAHFAIGQTSVTYTATDAANHTAMCGFVVNVIDPEFPVILNCPRTIMVNADPGACTKSVSWTVPTATDNAPGVSIVRTQGPAPGSTFIVGTTHVRYTATDASNNQTQCNFDVIVSDAQSPTINGCPSNITTNTTALGCVAVVTWTAPTASDNCPGVSIVQTQGPASGSTFPNGITTIKYTATDAANLTTICTFAVSVVPTPDVNNDGVVNLLDVAPFTQVLLGNDTDPLHRARADANCDGLFNGRDIAPFVDAILP